MLTEKWHQPVLLECLCWIALTGSDCSSVLSLYCLVFTHIKSDWLQAGQMVRTFPNEQKSVSVTKSRLGSLNNVLFMIIYFGDSGWLRTGGDFDPVTRTIEVVLRFFGSEPDERTWVDSNETMPLTLKNLLKLKRRGVRDDAESGSGTFRLNEARCHCFEAVPTHLPSHLFAFVSAPLPFFRHFRIHPPPPRAYKNRSVRLCACTLAANVEAC